MKKLMALLLSIALIVTLLPVPSALASKIDLNLTSEATTIVLSNEGGLIDELIAAGYGNYCIYETLEALQSTSGGVISDAFLRTLADTYPNSEVFTAKLSSFSAAASNPIAINTDGSLMVVDITGEEYDGKTGYSTVSDTQTGVGKELFTYATSSAYYIDTGTSSGGSANYKAFAVIWAPSITVAGTATDDTAILQIDNKTPSVNDGTWTISVTTGTLKGTKGDDITSYVTLSNLPAGLTYTAKNGGDNTIVITLSGAATTALTADVAVTAVIKAGAVSETGAKNSAAITLNLCCMGEATTLVLTNEAGGYLLDTLISDGYGGDTMYQIVSLLQPSSNGAIPKKFVELLASCPAGSEIFTATLKSMVDNGTYPIGVNSDGTLLIADISGKDFYGKTGYSTYAGTGSDELFTYASSSTYYIAVGSVVINTNTTYYKAFAVAWSGGFAAGTASDSSVTMASGNTVASSSDNTWDIAVTSGTLTGVSGTDLTNCVTVTGLPSGLSYTAVNGGNNDIVITVSGTANSALTSTATVSVVVKADAVSNVGMGASGAISVYIYKNTSGTSTGGSISSGGTTYTADVEKGGVKTGTLSVTVDSSKTGMVSLTTTKAAELFSMENASVVMPTISGVSSYTLTLSASALSDSQESGTLTLSTGTGSVTFADSMLSSLTGASGKTAGITIARGDTSSLTDAEKSAIGDHPIVQLTLTLDGTQTDWNNPAAPVTVTIPYTPTAAELENPDSIVIWYLDGSGKLTCVPNGHYDAATGTVTFTTTHFSQYAVGYNNVSFKDVSGWYADYVKYIAARGIINGTGDGIFSPDADITRAQFVTILANLSGDNLNGYTASSFSDVSATDWYCKAVQWAYEKGVAVGSDGKFSPNANITRQDMAVMTLRYVEKVAGYTLPETISAVTFTDGAEIASYASEAVTAMQRSGIISGNSDCSFAPTDNATRAQAAKIIALLLQGMAK